MKNLIDLGSPSPRLQETLTVNYSYPRISEESLPFPVATSDIYFDQTVFGRRTVYGGTSLNRMNLAAVLWRTVYCQQKRLSTSGNEIKLRPVISAGARHAIDVLVIEKMGQLRMHLYNDDKHSLSALDVPSSAIMALWRKASNAAQGTASTLFWFVAQPNKTISKYECPDTLIWRDAGALLQQFALVAQALGLACVPLGPTGNPEIDHIFKSDGSLLGVGGCFVSELKC